MNLCGPIAAEFDELVTAKALKQAEIDRYCGLGPCAEAACADAGGGTWVAVCADGFCAAVHPDAGVDLDAAVGLDAAVDLDGAVDLDAGIPDA